MPTSASLLLDGVAMSPIRLDKDSLPTAVFGIHLARARRVADRRIQPRRNVADGRSHPHRRARLRAGRRARRRARRARRSRQEGARRAVAQHGRPSAGAGRAGGARPRTGVERVHGRRRAEARRGDRHRAARLDRHRRAADGRSLRQRHPAPAAAVRGDFSGAAGHDLGRLAVRALVHLADPDAAARDAVGGLRSPRGARRHPDRRRVRGSRRRVQHDGQPAGRAAGETSSGRSARRRSAASPRAWSTISRTRFRIWATARACWCATTSTPNRACRFAPRSSASSRTSSGSWTTCATSSSRGRWSVSCWMSMVRSWRSSRRCGPKGRGWVSPSKPAMRADPLVIEGDRFALSRVYRNLMTNAIQATQPGGRVVVTTARRGDQVEIGVSRHRLRHRAGAASRRLRGFRHDQAPRAGAGTGDLKTHRRAAQRHHRRDERAWTRDGIHDPVPGPRRSQRPTRRPANRRTR